MRVIINTSKYKIEVNFSGSGRITQDKQVTRGAGAMVASAVLHVHRRTNQANAVDSPDACEIIAKRSSSSTPTG